MSKILVTGGAGFIGSHIVDALITQGDDVVIVDNLVTGKKENINPRAKFVEMDINDPAIKNLFATEKFDFVFHLAAQMDVRKSVENPIFDAQTNILGGINILENCKNFGVKKIIFSSTGGATYGEADIVPTPEDYPQWPLSPYGISKVAFEKYVFYYHQVFGLKYVILRYGNIYGPRQNAQGEAGVVAIFINKILHGDQPIINGDGRQTRDYIFVADVVRANLLALKTERVDIYNIGTGVQTDVNEIFNLINANLNNQAKEIHGEGKLGEQRVSCLDASKIKRDLGWEPEVSIDLGIKQTVEWFRNRLSQI